MSVLYCHDCGRRWDSDFHEECPTCPLTMEQILGPALTKRAIISSELTCPVSEP